MLLSEIRIFVFCNALDPIIVRGSKKAGWVLIVRLENSSFGQALEGWLRCSGRGHVA